MTNKLFAASMMSLSLFIGCDFSERNPASTLNPGIPTDNIVNLGETKTIGNEAVQFEVTTSDQFQSLDFFSFDGEGDVQPASNDPRSLVLGYPLDLLGKESVFGGVITKVSNYDNESLGGLKLSDIAPLHVTTSLEQQGTQYLLVISGCVEECTEHAADQPLIAIPVLSIDSTKQLAYLDLATLGKELDVVGLMGAAEYFKLEHRDSSAVHVDFTNNTVVFDVESNYDITGPMPSEDDMGIEKAPPVDTESKITTRYYLKLEPKTNTNFKSREPVEEVGFFTTQRNQTTYITRFDLSGSKKIKYYIKDVPSEYVASFTKAFDSWNDEFKKVTGLELFEYEVIPQGDPRGKLLVPGDIRYNILEWDLLNKAGYGGLGPSVANQMTGETLSANVLIQGPTIDALYKEWFGLSNKIKNLIALGDVEQANQLKMNFQNKVAKLTAVSPIKHQMRLGKLKFHIPAEDPRYQDSEESTLFFEEIPAGYTYEQYMYGYFLEMVAHEVGHNVGLRHNFRGNLGTDDSMTEGSVSRSIMEYMGRGFRHLNRISEYDAMAVEYGYSGVLPKHKDWFCTDENVPGLDMPVGNPECSREDATSDPFSFFEKRLDRMLGLVTNRGSSQAPVWNQSDIAKQFKEAVTNMGLYASAARWTADAWTNFFGKLDRPTDRTQTKDYVLEKLNKLVCDPKLADVINAKTDPAARQATIANIETFQKEFSKLVVKLNTLETIFTAQTISCLVN